MVSIEEAKIKIQEHVSMMDAEEISIGEALNRVLAKDIQSPLNLPSFRQSAMDGFAVMRADLEQGRRHFKVVSETQAGLTSEKILSSGQAIRIFTGAVVPTNADIVVIQEHTKFEEDDLEIVEYSSMNNSNIRSSGEQIKKGESALEKGHIIHPATIGFLASMGIGHVMVYRKPKITIITTGNELKEIGQELGLGEIYESNSRMLKSSLLNSSYSDVKEKRINDDYEKSVSQIKEALNETDVLILSGGISVGKYDFVKRALEENGVKEVFYKIKQKPGKPMYFGLKGEKLIFALPGNPASLLVCYYIYVLAALNQMSGKNVPNEVQIKKLVSEYIFKGDRPQFLKAKSYGTKVQLLEGQSSFILKSFAEADALVYIHGENRTLHKGSEVEVYPFN